MSLYKREYFATCGKDSKIDHGKTISNTRICNMNSWMLADNSCYGYIIIPSMLSGIYEWKFKINSQKAFGNICIGIDESDSKWINNDFSKQSSTYNYSYKSNGYKYHSGKFGLYGKRQYKKNDIITMKLELPNDISLSGILSYKQNNIDLGFAYCTIYRSYQIKYKMVVLLGSVPDSVTLLSYQCMNDNEQKLNDTVNIYIFYICT